MDQSLTTVDRRRIAMDIINTTFQCKDDVWVTAVATWAYTLAGLSDETLLKLWDDAHASD